jgi:hypothetical protein
MTEAGVLLSLLLNSRVYLFLGQEALFFHGHFWLVALRRAKW